MKLAVAAAALLLVAQSASAQQSPPAGPPQSSVSKDPANAPSGTYQLDPRHTSIIARVGHSGGISFSTFRFGTASGSLNWNSADPTASQVSVTVDMTSIQTPVANFASELIGDRILKTAQFHDAKFASTSIRRTGPNTGVISGTLTFMGQTKPVTIDAVMVGTGKGRTGPVIGFSGTMRFKRSDFGFTALIGVASDEIEMMLDGEFDKTA
jgi:polyisoprenoid-binding protein YceI